MFNSKLSERSNTPVERYLNHTMQPGIVYVGADGSTTKKYEVLNDQHIGEILLADKRTSVDVKKGDIIEGILMSKTIANQKVDGVSYRTLMIPLTNLKEVSSDVPSTDDKLKETKIFGMHPLTLVIGSIIGISLIVAVIKLTGKKS